MSEARNNVVAQTWTEGELARLAQRKRPIEAHTLAYLYRMAVDEGVPLGDNLLDALSTQSDDALLTVVATAHAEIENVATPYRWVQQLAENMIEARLHARRAERGGEKDTAPIAIPHPLVEATLETVFGPYEIDEAQLETVRPQLSEEEQQKLLTIEPERLEPEQIIPAHVVPRRVIVGNTTSVLAIKRRYAGSAVGIVLEHAIKRDRINDRVTIKPKKQPAPKRVSGVAS